MSTTNNPLLVKRRGVIYQRECNIPVWRLEMARRAGASPAALIEAFAGRTPQGLKSAFAYAQRNREEIDKLIRLRGPAAVPTGGDGANQPAEFEAELDTLLVADAELFRRLAR